mgnify:CR=1 FL=1
MHDKSFILIPSKKKYKKINLETGKIELFSQSKDESEKIHDIMLLENDKKHLLFRIENRELTFFITSKCNHHCEMSTLF